MWCARPLNVASIRGHSHYRIRSHLKLLSREATFFREGPSCIWRATPTRLPVTTNPSEGPATMYHSWNNTSRDMALFMASRKFSVSLAHVILFGNSTGPVKVFEVVPVVREAPFPTYMSRYERFFSL